MKKIVLTGLATGLFFVGMTGMAQATSMTLAQVGGNVDTLLFSGDLDNSGEAEELAWVTSVLGGTHTLEFKDDSLSGEWFDITGYSGYWAHALTTAPDYFLIKTGNIKGTDNEHFLYQNLASVDWAVINLVALGIDSANITQISHITEFDGNPVPEPATMLLFGTGLAGLAGMIRRRKEK